MSRNWYYGIKIGKREMTSKSIVLPRMCVIAILAGIYTLGFIITPYWTKTKSTAEMIFILALTIGIGAAWSFFSAKELTLRVEPLRWRQFFILLAGLIVLNLKPLTSDIPWRGDEGIHIARSLALASIIPIVWVFVFIIVFSATVYLAWKKSNWAIILGLLFVEGVISFNVVSNPLARIPSTILLRYPFLNYWFFALLPMAAIAAKVNPYQEVFYRVVPFLSTFLLVWIFQKDLFRSKTVPSLFWGLAAASMPLVYYYSSILYIELPAIVLMLIVCIHAPRLLKDEPATIRQNPAWYALILIGFIKETTIPFLVCFLGWRLIASVFRGRFSPGSLQQFLQKVGGEILIGMSALLPVVFYLFLRGTLSIQSRWFSLTLLNLTKPIVTRTVLHSFIEQLGYPFLLLFCGSIILLLWKKEYSMTGFFLSLFVLYPAFFAVDTYIYTGYSRFNLYILPPVLAGAAVLIKQLLENRKIVASITACAILALNVWASPVNLDGSKKPLWGNRLTDTSEHYYPYREALGWLKANYGNESIMFAGMYYPYPFDFYFGQLAWRPINLEYMSKYLDDNALSLSQAAAEAERDDMQVILFQVLGKDVPGANAAGPNFQETKIFKNEAHTLIVYTRKP